MEATTPNATLSPRTTADLRNAAREAADGLRWAEAADLYRQALEMYPANTGALATRDRERLADDERLCREMLEGEARQSSGQRLADQMLDLLSPEARAGVMKHIA